MILDEFLKVDFMRRLRNKATPKFPKNIFKEPLFMDRAVRYLMENYRSGEINSAYIYARLGETAGLFVIALSEGYHIKDIAKTAKLPRRSPHNSYKRSGGTDVEFVTCIR